MNDAIRRVRERQQGTRLSVEAGPSMQEAYKALLAMLAAHLDCETETVGSCVYCRTHGQRMYQGAALSAEEKAALREECERLGVPIGGAQ